jgi:hypothetical protein
MLDCPGGRLVQDEEQRRLVRINLPHARTVLQRVGRSLAALGAFEGDGRNGDAGRLSDAFDAVEGRLRGFDDDPPAGEALRAADAVAAEARGLVAAILETTARGERLGQHVRNLFECLGLAEEGSELALRCGEREDSPLR